MREIFGCISEMNDRTAVYHLLSIWGRGGKYVSKDGRLRGKKASLNTIIYVSLSDEDDVAVFMPKFFMSPRRFRVRR